MLVSLNFKKSARIKKKVHQFETVAKFLIFCLYFLCADPGTAVISFDFAQNLSYPSSAQQIGKSYFKSGRKCELFGITNETTKKQCNYLIDEPQIIGKGPNCVISIIHNYVESVLATQPETLILFADNCGAQNKNNTMIWYLMWRVATGKNQKISLNFMLSGHTKFGPDRYFGLIKKLYGQSDIDSIEDIISCVQNSSHSGFNEPRVASDLWYNWTDFLSQFYKKLNGVSTYHHFTFEENRVTVKRLASSNETDEFYLQLLPPSGFPEKITPGGLSVERQWYLYEEVRSLCRLDENRDKVAPKPTVEKTKPKKRNQSTSSSTGRKTKRVKKTPKKPEAEENNNENESSLAKEIKKRKPKTPKEDKVDETKTVNTRKPRKIQKDSTPKESKSTNKRQKK